ncbi:g8456 [Coccomyxa elongata]
MTTNASITDKQIVVVGANRGIGYEFAKKFLEKGNRVVATARDLSKASSLNKLKEQHAGLELTELDVTSPDARKEWAQELRKKVNAVDYLINNAGVASWGGLGQLTEEELLHCIRTNTLGPLLVTQEVLGAKLLKNGSVVANLTSKMGSMADNTSGGTYAYRASKAALNAVTKSLALDLQERGITAVLLHPGWVKTDMTRHSGLIDAQTSVAGMISVLESSKPLVGRWGVGVRNTTLSAHAEKKMKYSQYLKALECDAPPEWRGKFLAYKRLKKLLRRQRRECSTCTEGSKEPCYSAQEANFFEQLHWEVQAVNREFARMAKRVIKLSQQEGQQVQLSCCFKLSLCSKLLQRKSNAAIDQESLVSMAEWCRRYAQINSVGLRKILKKHDKLYKNRAGHEYMQEIWSGGRRRYGTFLHSPLLDELKSLESMLVRQAAKCSTKAGNGADERPKDPSISVWLGGADAPERMSLPSLPSLSPNAIVAQHFEQAPQGGGAVASVELAMGASNVVAQAVLANEAAMRKELQLSRFSMTSSGTGGTEEMEIDPEYQCPICLEAMYKPLGLECGHKFCADCAFSCVGKGNALGTVRAILDHVREDAACPECRTIGVFVKAIELKATDKLIKQRFPKAWAERAEEARAKEVRLRELLAIQRQRQALPYHLGRVPF